MININKTVSKTQKFQGEITVAADKSISHRAVIFSALAPGESQIQNFLVAEDTLATCRIMQQLGIDIAANHTTLRIKGQGLHGLTEPQDILYCGNSGTTMRLLTGLLAGLNFFTVLSGDNSLNQRPMQRIINPLNQMGANIYARGEKYAPLAVKGANLQGINYHSPVASAQIKSALLLAGLTANNPTTIIEPQKSRDHSERMLAAMGADLKAQDLSITITPGRELTNQDIMIPNDISSAAFFMVAASIIPGAEVLIKNVGLNPTRAGILEVLTSMGANIKIENEKVISGELVADLVIKGSQLNSIEIQGEIMPRLIDELPIIAVAMAVADGTSLVKDAGELRVKETDRIKAICTELRKMGVDIIETEDGFIINGNYDSLRGNTVDSWGDHRIAMALAVAALVAGETTINNARAVDISFPEFWAKLDELCTK